MSGRAEENKKAGADQDLDETQDGGEPVEKVFSPEPTLAITLTIAIGSKIANIKLTMLGSLSW